MGTVSYEPLVEISGMAVSRKNPGVIWVNNDSGAPPCLYALDMKGEFITIFTAMGALAVDWEDMAIGPGKEPGRDYLYIGDIGDNARIRPFVTVYRVPEPEVTPSPGSVPLNPMDLEILRLKYPDAPHDAETVLVDPETCDIYLISKDRERRGYFGVYRSPAPHVSGETTTMDLVTTVPESMLITGGDVSPGGDAVILRTYWNKGFFWRRPSGTLLGDVFTSPSCPIPLALEPQGEALGFSADGFHYYTLSEGRNQPLNFYRQITPTATPTPTSTPSPTASPTPTPSPTVTPTPSPSPTPTATPSPTASPSPTPSPTPLPTPTPAPQGLIVY